MGGLKVLNDKRSGRHTKPELNTEGVLRKEETTIKKCWRREKRCPMGIVLKKKEGCPTTTLLAEDAEDGADTDVLSAEVANACYQIAQVLHQRWHLSSGLLKRGRGPRRVRYRSAGVDDTRAAVVVAALHALLVYSSVSSQ